MIVTAIYTRSKAVKRVTSKVLFQVFLAIRMYFSATYSYSSNPPPPPHFVSIGFTDFEE